MIVELRWVGPTDWHITVGLGGLLAQVGPASIAVDRGAAWPADHVGEHCCECEHPDTACGHDIEFGFREEDLGVLFDAVERGALTAETAMAEFVAGVRAEPDDDGSC